MASFPLKLIKVIGELQVMWDVKVLHNQVIWNNSYVWHHADRHIINWDMPDLPLHVLFVMQSWRAYSFKWYANAFVRTLVSSCFARLWRVKYVLWGIIFLMFLLFVRLCSHLVYFTTARHLAACSLHVEFGGCTESLQLYKNQQFQGSQDLQWYNLSFTWLARWTLHSV